ncbi:ABC transporter permease [Microbacterium terrisoli]|uniref:ABC transporter permease n=1 Tax=Microbacterium terrisoli TaxID=3242192 RepID=UPI00280537D9|nr:ABC transporter permease [Microbacterium protaetiae]
MMTVIAKSASRGSIRRRHAPDRARRWIGSLGGVVLVLVLLELVIRLEILPSRFLPPPTVVVATLFTELGTANAWWATLDTLRGWAIGLGLAALIAVPLGLLLGSSEFAYRATRPIVEFLRPVPSVALIPLVFLLFGRNLGDGKIFLAVFAAVWPLLIQTIYGVRNVLPTQLDTARSFQIRRRDVALHVVLPSALPYLATGVRIASTVSLILVLTGEIVINAGGIGEQINLAREGGAVAVMYAFVVLSGILGLLLNTIFARLERRLLRWHPSQRRAQS